MAYFDDLQLLNGLIVPHCLVDMDTSFPDTFSVEFILSGKMYFGIDGSKQIILDGPALFWHHPRHNYQYGPACSGGWYHHWITLRGARAQRFVEEGFMLLSSDGYLPVRNGKLFHNLFQSILHTLHECEGNRQGEAAHLLERVLLQAQQEKSASGVYSPHASAIREIAEAISADPFANYCFPREASSLGLSFSHFRRLFTAQIEQPPTEYVLTCRMRKAAQMLSDPQQLIKDIAYKCGYEDISQFSRMFKRKNGLSPKYYRALSSISH